MACGCVRCGRRGLSLRLVRGVVARVAFPNVALLLLVGLSVAGYMHVLAQRAKGGDSLALDESTLGVAVEYVRDLLDGARTRLTSVQRLARYACQSQRQPI